MLTERLGVNGFRRSRYANRGGHHQPDDTSAAGDQLLSAVEQATSGLIDPGFAMDSAWRGALPPMDGFEHLDDVPAPGADRTGAAGQRLGTGAWK